MAASFTDWVLLVSDVGGMDFEEAGFLLLGAFAVDLFGTFFLTSEEFAGELFFTGCFVAIMAFVATFPLCFKAELVPTVVFPLLVFPLFPVMVVAGRFVPGALFLTVLGPVGFAFAVPRVLVPADFFKGTTWGDFPLGVTEVFTVLLANAAVFELFDPTVALTLCTGFLDTGLLAGFLAADREFVDGLEIVFLASMYLSALAVE